MLQRLLVAAGLVLSASLAGAAPPDSATRAAVVNQLAQTIDARYVFPELGKTMATALQERLREGAYDQLADGAEFAALLTSDLRQIARDKHLQVRYSETVLAPQRPPLTAQAGGSAEATAAVPGRSCGTNEDVLNEMGKLDCFPGNIGYFEVSSFKRKDAATSAAVAKAMDRLAGTSSLIIDLRSNGGGDPAMVALISSYLFDQPTHLNDLYWREGNRTTQFWTSATVDGKRYGQARDVYVLTSGKTFSAAEEFSYNLKNLKRATVVGETTGGGANPGGVFRLGDHYSAFVPTGRAINPITKTNWEGSGVIPDVPTRAPDALDTAQVLALKKLIAAQPDAKGRAALGQRLAQLEEELRQRR